MSDFYRPYKIPSNDPFYETESEPESSEDLQSAKRPSPSASFDQRFAEIEIVSNLGSSLNSAPVPQSVNPVLDPIRRTFKAMREIAWNNHSSYVYNLKFYNKNTQHENSRVFYKQAVFMQDFEDDYEDWVPFSSYYPYYQLMKYEQLRTYFSWRSRVREGLVEEVSLSYAYVYIYELLNNIGVNDPAEGLRKLMAFRKAFKRHDASIDKYLIKWIKDYYVYYQLEASFKDIIYEYNLEGHFPEILEYEPELTTNLESLCELSKYNIRKSAFYKENSTLIKECLEFVINRLKSIFTDAGLNIYNIIYELSSKKSAWTPFKGALFYPRLKQPDKVTVLSFNEAYICSQNTWFSTSLVCTDGGKQLMTYVFKQMEAVLRKVSAYKHKLTANPDIINDSLLKILTDKGISIEKAVTDAVTDFHREKTKIVVTVDPNALNRIRSEAEYTQQKLIVPEDIADAPPVKNLDLFSWLDSNINDNKSASVKQKDSDFKSVDLGLKFADFSLQSAGLGPQSADSGCQSANPQHISSGLQHADVDHESADTGYKPAELSLQSSDLGLCPTDSGLQLDDSGSQPAGFGPQLEDSGSQPAGSDLKFDISGSKPDDLSLRPDSPSLSAPSLSAPSLSSGWTGLRQALTDVEIAALSAILQGRRDMKQFADEHGIMLELLADGINGCRAR